MLRISYKDRVTNEEVLRRANVDRTLIKDIVQIQFFMAHSHQNNSVVCCCLPTPPCVMGGVRFFRQTLVGTVCADSGRYSLPCIWWISSYSVHCIRSTLSSQIIVLRHTSRVQGNGTTYYTGLQLSLNFLYYTKLVIW